MSVSSPSVRIRLATADDTPAVLALGVRMHAESRFRGHPMNADKTRAAVHALIANAAAGCVLLAEHARHGVVGMLAGYVTDYFFSDVRVAQDKWFYVLPQHRGSSAALKLMIAFRRWAENRQARELCINMSVDIDQPRFDRFMRHLDFRSCGSNFVLALAPVAAGSTTRP
jgi:GNAT superfamily N-acetyltransferase